MTSILLVVLTTVVVLTVVVLYRKRKPTVVESARNLRLEIQRSVRDSANTAKDAAEDARNALRDATKLSSDFAVLVRDPEFSPTNGQLLTNYFRKPYVSSPACRFLSPPRVSVVPGSHGR